MPIDLADESETIDYVLVYNDDELSKRDEEEQLRRKDNKKEKKEKDSSKTKVANYLNNLLVNGLHWDIKVNNKLNINKCSYLFI